MTDGGGATTIAPPDEPHMRWPWYIAGGAVLAGAVAVIVLGSQRGRTPAPLPDDPVVDEPVVAPPAAVRDEPLRPPPSPTRLDPGPAADRLATLLAGVRLYATVEAIGDTIELRSSFCAEAGLARPIAEVASELREAGVVTVRCRALHGAEQWTRPLP